MANEQTERLSWDQYFINIAKEVAKRGTCDRKKVGYIIVKDKRILATGYNGSISGELHCDDAGHMMDNNHCVRTIHAEVNTLTQAAKHGISIDGATMYGTWGPPCWNCFKQIANAGIVKIVYSEPTKDEHHKKSLVEATASMLGIKILLM